MYLGSSPRVWGQVPIGVIRNPIVGIIPTRMGTSDNYTVDGDLFRDHPHAYGDKNQVQRKGLQYIGSSPRVWGQDKHSCYRYECRWIIPTRMGTSSLETEYLSIIKDHPHAYGDKVVKETILKCLMGSSPRVWGQVGYRTIT